MACASLVSSNVFFTSSKSLLGFKFSICLRPKEDDAFVFNLSIILLNSKTLSDFSFILPPNYCGVCHNIFIISIIDKNPKFILI